MSRIVKIGAVPLGDNSPILIQTMWKDRLCAADLEGEAGKAVVERIERLSQMGCGLLRFAVPDMSAAETLGRLAGMVSMPLVADIHFNYQIALRCMDFPIAKIRINPGNIGGREKVRAVLEKAGAHGIPIRIGVNAGSLPLDLRGGAEDDALAGVAGITEAGTHTGAADTAEALVEAAQRELALCDEFNFSDVVVSMKASGIADTIRANRILAGKTDVPLHIGVTEAGPLIAGTARSSPALAALLAGGIGDTLRVSLSDSMENEIIAAREICNAAVDLAALAGRRAAGRAAARLRHTGVTVISCPRCGRYRFDTHGFTDRWLPRLYALDRKMTVAIMGCEVNGPEEARFADVGITGSGHKVLIFRHGKVVRTVNAEEADAAFAQELGLSP